MFELFFGLFWEAITTFISVTFLATGGITQEGSLFLIIFFTVFHAIGIFMLVKGIRKIIRDNKTNKLGEECYGCVIDLHPNGNYVNGSPQLNAKVLIYVKSEAQTKEIEEYAGTGISKYNVGEYIKVKYYNNDINFIGKVTENEIPLDVKNYIYRETPPIVPPQAQTPQQQGPIVYYESQDIVQVDGVRYKRIDS